jgi:hypothetical protein
MSGTSEPFSVVDTPWVPNLPKTTSLAAALRVTSCRLIRRCGGRDRICPCPCNRRQARGLRKRKRRMNNKRVKKPIPPRSRHRGQGVLYFGCFFTHFLGTERQTATIAPPYYRRTHAVNGPFAHARNLCRVIKFQKNSKGIMKSVCN